MGWIPETTVLTEMGDSGCRRDNGGCFIGGDFLDPDATIGTKITPVDFRFGEYFRCLHPNHGKRSILHLVPSGDFPLDFITYQLSASTNPTQSALQKKPVNKKTPKPCLSFFWSFPWNVTARPAAQPAVRWFDATMGGDSGGRKSLPTSFDGGAIRIQDKSLKLLLPLKTICVSCCFPVVCWVNCRGAAIFFRGGKGDVGPWKCWGDVIYKKN